MLEYDYNTQGKNQEHPRLLILKSNVDIKDLVLYQGLDF